jgi:hypothetical protein
MNIIEDLNRIVYQFSDMGWYGAADAIEKLLNKHGHHVRPKVNAVDQFEYRGFLVYNNNPERTDGHMWAARWIGSKDVWCHYGEYGLWRLEDLLPELDNRLAEIEDSHDGKR